MKIIWKLAIAGLLVLLTIYSHAQEDSTQTARPLYIIFDGSNSMWGELPDKSRKIAVAKDVFNKLDKSMFEGREVALRLYGHRRASDCSDTELAVAFTGSADAKAELSKAITAVSPRGKTPISRSLTAALKDFDGRSGEILLISDGIETCDADPCELVESWKEQNIDIRVHVVGLGLSDLARGAMQCISNASGTQYMDANSTVELSKAIETTAKAPPMLAGEANPKPQASGPEFKIAAEDENGNYLPVKGTISKPGMEAEEIKSNFRYVFEGGDYTINVGVPTVNGVIYKPITQEIKVNDIGSTKIKVMLSKPPSVSTNFLENGKEVPGAGVYAFVDDKRVFHLRQREDFFVMPGTYEFRTNLRTDNSDLRLVETIVDGEDKVITFNLIETVKTSFYVTYQESGKRIRQHQELWQDGEQKYKIHHANGAKVRPGTYTLKSESVHTPYEIENVVVPPGETQILNFELPFGKAKISYRVPEPPLIDGKAKKKDVRCWLYRVDAEGKKSARSGRMQKCDGVSEITLAEGRYFVYTTKTYGVFEDTYFNVKTGETTTVEVVLKK